MNTTTVRQAVSATELLTLVLDQLRDPLAIGLAAATGVLTYLFAQPESVAIAAAGSVLFVRVAAGLLNPPASTPLITPPSALTDEDLAIATLVGLRLDDHQIATRRGLTKKAVAKLVERIQRTLGFETRKEIEDWAVLVRIVEPPPPPPKPIYDRWLTRMILMSASFIGLGWTLYSIVNRFWPQVFPR
jgi:DNA-binding NarL/FixJ family response regulator